MLISYLETLNFKCFFFVTGYDVESSVELLVRNHCWVSAIELTASLKRLQLVSGVILPAMRDAFSDLAETISEKTSAVCALTSRMEEIIVKKKETLALQEYVGKMMLRLFKL